MSNEHDFKVGDFVQFRQDLHCNIGDEGTVSVIPSNCITEILSFDGIYAELCIGIKTKALSELVKSGAHPKFKRGDRVTFEDAATGEWHIVTTKLLTDGHIQYMIDETKTYARVIKLEPEIYHV